MFDNERFCLYEYPVIDVIEKIKPFRKDKVALMMIRKDMKHKVNDGNFPLNKKDEYIRSINRLKSDINDVYNSTKLKAGLTHNSSIRDYEKSNFELKQEQPYEDTKAKDKKYELLEEILTKIDSDASLDSIILKYVCDMIVESGDTESELIKCLIDNAFTYREIKNKNKSAD